ncbi:hypothetical protein D3C84_1082850 [compost metagenome]
MQRLQHAEEGILQGLAADEVGLGVDPLIPLQIHLVGEPSTIQFRCQVMHKQLNTLLVAPWQAIEATPRLQIDHGFQPLMAFEGKTGA